MVKGKPWRSVLVGSDAWVLYIRPWLAREKRTLDGFTNWKNKSIYIRAALDTDDWEDTLLHELLHAAMFSSRGDEMIRKWSSSYEQAYNREERLVRKLTPALLTALKSLGWTPPRREDET